MSSTASALPTGTNSIGEAADVIRRGDATTVRVRYSVYANEFNLRTRGLNDEHAFVDGAAVFLYAEAYRSVPVALEVRPYGNWHVTTGLEGSGTHFSAPDYDTFADCPIEVGNQIDAPFDVDGVHPHDVAQVLGFEGVAIRAGSSIRPRTLPQCRLEDAGSPSLANHLKVANG